YGLCIPCASMFMKLRASSAVVMPRVTNILAKTDEMDNSFWMACTRSISGVVKRHRFLDSIMYIHFLTRSLYRISAQTKRSCPKRNSGQLLCVEASAAMEGQKQ